ncbi:hypothetical protein [Rhodanobacter sp. FW106-PBR-R2A-1-13]|uniref:hypothetical protein n=1 Tax=Rhodanobacter sp. FW106-PBR-R2A-1-13 TaxID=3454845 RepID=UPI0034E4802A
MLDRDEVKSFFTFLDTASDRELSERQKALQDMEGVLQQGSDARKDVQFLIRKLREEQAARINVIWARHHRNERQA